MKRVMVRPGEIAVMFHEALSVYEAFRKLGFPSEAITFVHGPFKDAPALTLLQVRLQHEGFEFVVDCGTTSGITPAEVEQEWIATCELVNAGKIAQSYLDAMWQSSFIFKHKVDFMSTMVAKGFKPRRPEGLN